MTTVNLYRLSGLALIVGSLLVSVSSTISGVMFPDTSSPTAATDPLNMLQASVGVFGASLLLFGLPGMYANAARAGGLPWLAGVVLIAITTVLFGIFLGLSALLVAPVLATQAPEVLRNGPPPSFLAVFIVGTLANVVGAVLMGLPMITGGVYPRWCGYALLVAAVLAILSFLANGPSASESVVSQILNVVSSLPLLLALGWVGYELWCLQPAMTEVVGSAAAPQPA